MDHQCNCGNTHNEGELGVQYNLYTKIDMNNVECLNEYEEGSGVTVFKPWEDRLNHDKYVESDVDDELLFNIPFTGNVKLKGLIIIGGSDDSYPLKVKLFKNRPHMTFDNVATEPEQEFELCKDDHGFHEYPIKIVKFSSVHHLTLHFSGNNGAERTRINYIGLKGEWTPGHRHGITICTYESRPMISDHVTDLNVVNREIQ
ncbi:PITH domain-containing protein GA19395 [Cephus cinctus]|uniref:PITH domain-containing protein GA19395 n=1 Tax=Cephus cinctus TaxID=211228 RepID=A0AAJ7FTP8_CEPCN|nr:PITH domain-containing protein GA19395 [Cephus cinctus]XP_015607758.1 PITH domain-containing protein GA19395 [Cephus cinctus]